MTRLFNKFFILSAIFVLLYSSQAQSALVGHWKLDEEAINPETQIIDSGQHSLNGFVVKTDQLKNIPQSFPQTPEVLKNIYQHSLDLDGVDDYIEISDHDALSFSTPDAQFTIANWIYFDQEQQSDYIGKYNSRDRQSEYAIRILPYGDIDIAMVEQRTGRLSVYRTKGADFKPQEWIHITVIVDTPAKEVRFYKNGNLLEASLVMGQFPRGLNNSTEPLRIGSVMTSGGMGAFFDGKMSDLRIYNHALSLDEIKQLVEGSVYAQEK